MNMIFLGAPGAGKGTQAEVVCKELNIPAISTGNMLREAVKNGTDAGLAAKKYMDAQDDAKNGFILGGFPRTVPQAEALEKMGVQIDKVIEIDVADEAITARMSGRRVCEKCGNSYHIEHKPTKVEGICDACGGKVVQRADDKPETVVARLKTYHEKTAPLKDFYSERGKLTSVKGQDSIEETSKLVLAAIKG